MKPKILNEKHPNYKFCNQLFQEFKEEDLIWVCYLWTNMKNLRKNEYLDFLNERPSFQAISSYLEKEFETAIEEDIKFLIDKCYRNRIRYIPRDNLKFLSNNNRLCWFIINNLIDENNHLKVLPANYIHPYFSLLFLIHIELLDNRINIEYIRDKSKIIIDKKNPYAVLKNYINDQIFIEWALEYTEDKYKIKTIPHFTPVENNEKFEVLISYWDFLYFQEEYKYLHDINLLKKAWQQKQFRDKGGLKKPYHLPLTKKTKSQLEVLAEKMNISETKVLENLIEDAYKNEMLDEKGKARY